MKKINVGIVGYGNVGKACEKVCLSDERLRLVAIFSQRDVQSESGTKIEKLKNLAEFVGKIDVLLLCCGSFDEVEKLSLVAIENFNIVDCFFFFSKLLTHTKKMDGLAKQNKKVLFCACGWDPGILSLIRLLFAAVSNEQNIHTFWGKGVSQGHSNALRKLGGVSDAIQFTIPQKKAIKNILKCKKTLQHPQKHSRLCFVVAKKGSNKKQIAKNICQLPNYFAGYPTKVRFVAQKKVDRLKQKMSHKGKVLCSFECFDEKFDMRFDLNLSSNPIFTALCMKMAVFATKQLCQNKRFGAHTLFDVPPHMLTGKSLDECISTFL